MRRVVDGGVIDRPLGKISEKQNDCGHDAKDQGENPSAVSIHGTGSFQVAVFCQLARDDRLNEGDKDKQRAEENEFIKAGEIGKFWHIGIDGEAVGDQGQHRRHRNAELGSGVGGIDPEDSPGHHDDEQQWQQYLDDEIRRIARSGELEIATGDLGSRGNDIGPYRAVGGKNVPVGHGDLRGDPDAVFQPDPQPLFPWQEEDLVGAVARRDKVDAEGAPVKGEGSQIECL